MLSKQLFFYSIHIKLIVDNREKSIMTRHNFRDIRDEKQKFNILLQIYKYECIKTNK